MIRIILVCLCLIFEQAAFAATPAERVAAVSYRLQTSGRALCNDLDPMVSFLIADEKSAVVQLVVPDAPAARAGLRAGDTIVAINGHATVGVNVADLIDTALDSGTVSLVLADQRTIMFPVEQGCGFPVAVENNSRLDAYADGKAAAVSSALVDFTKTDDELAVIIGHELAHNILKHKDILDSEHVSRGFLAVFGKNAERIRQTEEDADVMALYLMIRSGYDITVAPDFWSKFGARTGAGVFGDGTHPRTKARVALAMNTIATIRAQQAKGEPLTPHFRSPN